MYNIVAEDSILHIDDRYLLELIIETQLNKKLSQSIAISAVTTISAKEAALIERNLSSRQENPPSAITGSAVIPPTV